MTPNAAIALAVSPAASVRMARDAMFQRRSTSPTAVAAMGNRSGLIAIAPTTSVAEPVTTPTAATTPAAAMLSR